MMMTPVCNVVTVDWNTNNCGRYQHAARRGPSAFSSRVLLEPGTLFSTRKIFISWCSQQVKKYRSQCFHAPTAKSAQHVVSLSRQQPEKELFFNQEYLAPNSSSQQKCNHNCHSPEMNPLRCYDLETSGDDVLFQLSTFERIVTKMSVLFLTAPSKNNRRSTPQPPLTRRSNAA